jgi:2-polyprenyl-3-methyl-5-hydroxy-6-metoxy-1,4-benzoquinol methylase
MSAIDFPNLRQHPLGFWEVVDKPSATQLREYYANKYYQEARGSYESSYTPAELSYFRGKTRQRAAVVGRAVSAPGSLLDVGCGEGFTLAYFRELGWKVKGLDYSSAGLQANNPACADVLAVGDVFELLQAESESGNRYDVIWLQNVLEHVLDPVHLLVSLRGLVASGGVLVATVPNDFSTLQRNALNRKLIESPFWIALPDHLSYFSRESLVNIGTATGWSCEEVLADFPVDWFLYHSGSNYVRDRSVGKAVHLARVDLENLIGTADLEDVVGFYAALAKIGMGRDLTAFYRPVARAAP